MSNKRFSLFLLIALAVPEISFAHSPIEGLGNFYNGLLHPVFVPAHLLLLIATGLLIGQQQLENLELILGTFVVAALSGLTLAWFSVGEGAEIYILGLSTALGLLVAIGLNMNWLWPVIIALLAGFLIGIDSAQQELSGKDKLVTLFGNAVAIYFIALYVMFLVDQFNKQEWQKIGIRIIGSWVAASSLLVVALTLTKAV